VKPYYQDERVTIYLGDCRDILPELPRVDLVLTDPDYNAKNIGPNKREYEKGMPALDPDSYKTFCNEWFELTASITDDIVFTSGISNMWNYPEAKWVLCWHKPASISFNRLGGFNAWEPILVYGKPFKRLPQDYLYFNTLNFTKGPERKHPCPKPPDLWSYLISLLKEGIILDPFLGSGTTAYCAKKLNRHCIGIEIEEKYCEIAAIRCSQGVFNLETH
jgi:DNA modification methylase